MSAQLPKKGRAKNIDVSPAQELIIGRSRGYLEELWLYHQLILLDETIQSDTRIDRIGLGVHENESLEDEPPGATPGPLARKLASGASQGTLEEVWEPRRGLVLRIGENQNP